MLNIERKQQFFESIYRTRCNSSAKSHVKEAFTKYGDVEDKLGIDILDMTYEQVLDMIDTANNTTCASTFRARVGLVNQYNRWCFDNGYTTKRVRHTFNPSDIDKYCSAFFAGSPSDLNEFMDWVFDKPEAGTLDCTFRCFLWLAYIGVLNQEEACAIRKSAVSSDYSYVTVDSPTGSLRLKIPEIAKSSFKECVEREFFVFNNGLYANDVLREREPGDCLVRGLLKKQGNTNQTDKHTRMRTSIRRRVAEMRYRPADYDPKIAKIKLLYDRVYMSGFYFRVYIQSLTGGGAPDFMRAWSHNQELLGRTEYFSEQSKSVAYTAAEADFNNWMRYHHGK